MLFGKILAGIGVAILAGLLIPDAPKGVDINQIMKEAAKEKRSAQYKLGICYWKGTHVRKNELLAIHWLTLSAAQSYADAQFALGLIFARQRDADGKVSDENTILAMYWLDKAARNFHEEARVVLKKMKKDAEAKGVNTFDLDDVDFEDK